MSFVSHDGSDCIAVIILFGTCLLVSSRILSVNYSDLFLRYHVLRNPSLCFANHLQKPDNYLCYKRNVFEYR